MNEAARCALEHTARMCEAHIELMGAVGAAAVWADEAATLGNAIDPRYAHELDLRDVMLGERLSRWVRQLRWSYICPGQPIDETIGEELAAAEERASVAVTATRWWNRTGNLEAEPMIAWPAPVLRFDTGPGWRASCSLSAALERWKAETPATEEIFTVAGWDAALTHLYLDLTGTLGDEAVAWMRGAHRAAIVTRYLAVLRRSMAPVGPEDATRRATAGMHLMMRELDWSRFSIDEQLEVLSWLEPELGAAATAPVRQKLLARAEAQRQTA